MKTGYFLNGPPVEVISAWGPFKRTTTNPASRAHPRARRIACLWSGAGACGVTFPAPRLSLTRLVLSAPACASFLLSDWPSCHFSRPAPTSCVNTLAPICASHCVSWSGCAEEGVVVKGQEAVAATAERTLGCSDH